jgi:hypothetical protein
MGFARFDELIYRDCLSSSGFLPPRALMVTSMCGQYQNGGVGVIVRRIELAQSARATERWIDLLPAASQPLVRRGAGFFVLAFKSATLLPLRHKIERSRQASENPGW